MQIPSPTTQIKQTAIIRPTGKEPISLGSGTITKLLGDGGMASVYEIWNSQLEVNRAVKLLHPNCNIESQERFQTEIKITAKLHHPYIVEIHGVGEWNGLPYIEMEKADGVSLEELIHTRGALPLEVCVAIGLMVSKALEYAHNHEYVLYNNNYHGIIHRDLKPGNIMVCKDGSVKLMDFGIARPTDTSFHTIDGSVIGTLQYLSPEQVEGSELDIKTDIYSLGICIYEMSCGHLAFPESNISRLLADKSKNRFKPLSSYDIKIPNYFIDLIQQCMMHDKNRRPQTSSVLSLELSKIYNKISHNKPEDVVVKYLGASFKGRVSPKINAGNIKINRFHFMTIFLISILLYAVMIVSRKNHLYREEVVSTKVLEKQSVPIVDPTIKQPTNLKQEPIKKIISPVAKNIVENSSPIHIEPKEPKKIISAPDKSQTIEKLKFKYDTDDLLLIAQKEISLKNTSNALAILNILDANATRSIRAQVLKSRALEQLDYRVFSSYVLSIKTNEAELLLKKAKVSIDKGDLSSAETLLNKATTAHREIISPETVSNQVLYYKAISSSRRFDIKPNELSWREASEAWYIVKKEMRNQPTHEYYKKADDEISRISAKYRVIKG